MIAETPRQVASSGPGKRALGFGIGLTILGATGLGLTPLVVHGDVRMHWLLVAGGYLGNLFGRQLILGHWLPAAVALASAVAALTERRWVAASTVLVAPYLGVLICERLLKPAFLPLREAHGAYPSAHVTVAGAILSAWLWFPQSQPQKRLVVLAGWLLLLDSAFLLAVGGLSLEGAHSAADVIGGAFLGLAAASGVGAMATAIAWLRVRLATPRGEPTS